MKTQHYNRRQFTSQLLGGAITLGLSPALFAQKPLISEDEIDWYNVKEIGVEGKGWSNTQRYFDRFPSKAEGMVREAVWDLSRHSAGMCMRFLTDSPNIYIRYNLYLERLAMSHMPATGVSGLDLYANDNAGMDRWVSVVRPNKQEIDEQEVDDNKISIQEYASLDEEKQKLISSGYMVIRAIGKHGDKSLLNMARKNRCSYIFKKKKIFKTEK